MLVLLFFVLLVPSLAQAQVEYLATYEGDGTDANPYRAHGGISGTECAPLGKVALCKGPTLPVRAGIMDLSGKRALVKADRDRLSSEYKLAVTATTYDGLIAEVVDTQGLSLKRNGGRQRIVIHGREAWARPAPLSSYIPTLRDSLAAPVALVDWIISAPMAWAAATLNETFTCANDSDGTYACDHTWSRSTGSVARIVSNALSTPNSIATQRMRLTSSTLDSTDMYNRVTLSTISRGTATDRAGGPIIRHHSADTTYVFCVGRDAATQQLEYGSVLAGVLTSNGTVSATIANGDTVEVSAVNDQVSCKHNGTRVLGPTTDGTGDGELGIGLRVSGSGTATSTSVILDNVQSGLVSQRRAIAPLVLQ